ncbi:MAG TPA: acetate--CoA ligase family protein [Acidimicrobiales bacterium]|nr:acetate--CoA ligase family protein [Acidimicrobiales bacterium]
MPSTLSEAESKRRLAAHGVPVADERVVDDPEAAAAAATEIGFPVVAKLCGDGIAHKTERGLVRLRLGDEAAVRAAARELLDAATPDDGEVGVLVAPMVTGNRELIAGLHRDPQFGMTVMLGVGGILAEAVKDVTFRMVPLARVDAEDMLDDLSTSSLLGAFRGEAAVDRGAVVDLILALAAVAEAEADVVSADLNPVIITPEGRPVAVDALLEVEAR